MKTIYTTIVGSKMHGLDTPDSDEDIRHITLSSLSDVISPFKNDDVNVKSSNGDDIESWELRHFVKHLCQGNPTMYEVINSPLYTNCLLAPTIRGLMPLCLDSAKIIPAHNGYADAQIKRYLRPAYEDMNDAYLMHPRRGEDFPISEVWADNRYRRIPKAIVAGYRVLAQAEQLVNTGTFCPKVKDYSESLHDFLMEIKLSDPGHFTMKEIGDHWAALEEKMQELKTMSFKQKFTPDIPAIEKILVHIYVNHGPRT